MPLKTSFFSGFLWTGIQSLGTKIIGLITQLILAKLLVPEEFGKVGLATSITSIIFLFQSLGISDVLVSKGKYYKSLYNMAKSICLITSLICILITLIIGSIFSIYIYKDFEIFYIILILSFTVPLNSLSVVPDAKLRIELKFKELSIIRVLEYFIINILILILVLLGLGIFSFAVAPLLASFFRYILLHYTAKTSHTFKYSLSNYKYLFDKSIWGFVHNFSQSIIRNIDYLVIGYFVTKKAVGIYYMGFSLSVQAVALLVGSLSPLFFPILKKYVKENSKQTKSYLIKIVEAFALFGMCFAFLQIVLADKLIKIFLEEKWYETVLIVQILSFGIGFRISSTIWEASLVLLEKFKTQALYSLFSGLFFLLVVILTTKFYGIKGTSIGVAFYYILTNIFLLVNSLKYHNITFYQTIKPLFKYFFLAIFIFGVIYKFSLNFNTMTFFIFNGFVSVIVYFSLLYLLDSRTKEILDSLFFKKIYEKYK